MPSTNEIIRSTLDRFTGAVREINTDHYYIHRGIAYKAYLEIGEVTDTIEYAFKTGENEYPHFKNLVLQALGGTCKVTIKRGTKANPLVIDNAGDVPGEGDPEFAELTGPHNQNDATDKTANVTITKSPTYDASGDGDGKGEDWAIVKVLGDDTNQFTSISETQGNPNEELVMKPDTYYVIKVEKIGIDSPNNVLLTMFWYEEPEGYLEDGGD